ASLGSTASVQIPQGDATASFFNRARRGWRLAPAVARAKSRASASGEETKLQSFPREEEVVVVSRLARATPDLRSGPLVSHRRGGTGLRRRRALRRRVGRR